MLENYIEMKIIKSNLINFPLLKDISNPIDENYHDITDVMNYDHFSS